MLFLFPLIKYVWLLKFFNYKLTSKNFNISKHQFRHVIYYSIINSVLYVVKKRLNYTVLFFVGIIILFFTLL